MAVARYVVKPPVGISRPQQSAKIGETTLEKGPAQVQTSK